MERYLRHIKLLGEDGIKILQSSKVAVIGLGGLGGVVSELLVRYGVGNLFVCDGDKFEVSNLNRQLLSNEKTIGKNKANVAGQKLREININLRLEVLERHLDLDQSVDLNEDKEFLKSCDIVCDCLGDYESKIKLEKLALNINKPIVHSAIENDRFIVGSVDNQNNSWENVFGRKGVNFPESVDPASVWVAGSILARETVMFLLKKPELLGKIMEGFLSTGKIRVF